MALFSYLPVRALGDDCLTTRVFVGTITGGEDHGTTTEVFAQKESLFQI